MDNDIVDVSKISMKTRKDARKKRPYKANNASSLESKKKLTPSDMIKLGNRTER